MNSATQRLLELCEQSDWDPYPDAVAKCVAEGADVLYMTPGVGSPVKRGGVCGGNASGSFHDTSPSPHYSGEGEGEEALLEYPIFHFLVQHGRASAVKACLQTQAPIDFTRCGDMEEAVVHLLCSVATRDEDTVSMLKAILERLASDRGKKDRIDWGQKSLGQDTFIGLAAENQQLSLVYPLVRGVPYYAERRAAGTPLALRMIWEWDWDALPIPDKAAFTVEGAEVVRATENTGRLWRLCSRPDPSPQEVLRCVAGGDADVLFPDLVTRIPLHEFVLTGATQCVATCLSIAAPLDLTVQDSYGRTVFHCALFAGEEKRGVILHLLLDRILINMEDKVDWSREDESGFDFISAAASLGCLSSVWSVVVERRVSYFLQFEGRIPIRSKVEKADWMRLKEGEQERFDLIEGFEED